MIRIQDEMFAWLFILFVMVPLADLMLLVRLGGVMSIPVLIGLVLLTGAIGAALARHQGLSSLRRIQAELGAGRVPATELGEGLLILFAAALLVTPGFITDAMGVALLIPAVRRIAMKVVGRYFNSRIVMMHGGPFDDWKPAGPMKHVRNEAQNADEIRSNGDH
ncbi:MAG: FxsA family protein [Phycisphaerae bacterium]|nr:FxsA family protein [Phycisphaerae bacterium]